LVGVTSNQVQEHRPANLVVKHQRDGGEPHHCYEGEAEALQNDSPGGHRNQTGILVDRDALPIIEHMESVNKRAVGTNSRGRVATGD